MKIHHHHQSGIILLIIGPFLYEFTVIGVKNCLVKI